MLPGLRYRGAEKSAFKRNQKESAFYVTIKGGACVNLPSIPQKKQKATDICYLVYLFPMDVDRG
jgi:hypothetical protein